MRRVGLLAAALMVFGCSSSGQGGSASGLEPVRVEPPAIEAGALDIGSVRIADVEIDYITIVPADFEIGVTAPVLLAFPPGAQDLELTQSFSNNTYTAEAVDRGWVVVSPAAPSGQRFFDGSEDLVPGFVEWIRTWVEPQGDRLHLIGASNGGLSSFRFATGHPDDVASIVVFPGYPFNDKDRERLADLAGLPIRMFVGERDPNWLEPMQETLTTLTGLDADVTLDVRLGEGHIIRSLSDGVDLFDELDALR